MKLTVRMSLACLVLVAAPCVAQTPGRSLLNVAASAPTAMPQRAADTPPPPFSPSLAMLPPRAEDGAACHAVQGQLEAAMGSWECATGENLAYLSEETLAGWARDGHLATVPEDPGQGAGSSSNYFLLPKAGRIACRVHGTPDPLVRGWAVDMHGDLMSCIQTRGAISAAIARYSADKLPAKDLSPRFLKELVLRGYLPELPADPGQGPESAVNFVSWHVPGGIGCRVHTVRPRPAPAAKPTAGETIRGISLLIGGIRDALRQEAIRQNGGRP